MLFRTVNLKFRLLILLVCLYSIHFAFYTLTSQYDKFQTEMLSSSRIFIFTSDNRAIGNGLNKFYTLSAFINFIYARRYKYTFKYFHVIYNNTRNITKNVPFTPSAFNQVLNQERSVHWAKLQVIWHVLTTYSLTHDLFLYIDTDVVINNHNLSLTDLLSNISWVSSSKCKSFHINQCHIGFVYDSWNKNERFVVPNSGIFIFQVTQQFREFIKIWWNLNFSESNFFGFYEQDCLWNLLEDLPSPAAPTPTSAQLVNRKVWNTKLKKIFRYQNLSTHVGILNLKTFGNKNQSQFFVHMTGGLGINHRQPELFSIWQRVKGTVNQAQLLFDIERECVQEFDATNDRIPSNFSLLKLM